MIKNYVKKQQLNQAQHGFSLIELMVSLLIGTFIIGALVSVFISSSASYRVQKSLTEVQDKGRYVLRVIRESVQQAGFELEYSDAPIGLVTNGSDPCIDDIEVFELHWVDSADSLPRRQCYYLSAGDDNTFILMRNTMIDGAVPAAADAQPLIEHVEQLNYSFALDTNSDGAIDKVAGNTYQSGAQIDASASLTWQQVRGVRMEIVIASDTTFVTDGSQVLQEPFNLGVNITALNSQERMIQPFIATFALRNRIK